MSLDDIPSDDNGLIEMDFSCSDCHSSFALRNITITDASADKFNSSGDLQNVDGKSSSKSRDIPILPKQNPYNWVIAESHLESGKSYVFHADSVLVETGETPLVEAILYEHGSKRFCKRHKFPVGEDMTTSPLEWSFDVPQEEGEYSLLVYAGAAGKCEGIGVLYKGVSVKKSRSTNPIDAEVSPPRRL